MQGLTFQIARLIEQAENAQRTARLAPPNSATAQDMAATQQWLHERITAALEIQASLPARLVAFGSTVAERGLDKARERVGRLTNRLDDIAEAYAEIDDPFSAARRAQLTEEIERTLRDLDPPNERPG
ncbi:MAG: hypothetical protein HC915_03075 [Anaerolineae bacterium]|nr:hypothetical protein [Anaerolineae bacterium]